MLVFHTANESSQMPTKQLFGERFIFVFRDVNHGIWGCNHGAKRCEDIVKIVCEDEHEC